MDNETMTPEVETVEAAESEIDLSAFDDEWGDGPADTENAVDDFGNDAEAEPDAQPEEAEATEETEAAETETAEEAPASTEPQPEAKQEEGNQLFPLNYLGEIKEYSRDEVIELAQKGLNYDHIHQERQTLQAENGNLKSENSRLQEADAFIKELAQASNITVDELIESTRARILMSNAKLDGREMNEAEARRQVREAAKKAKEEKTVKDEQEQKEPAASDEKGENGSNKGDPQQEKKNAEISRFAALYPELDPKTIPNSVWEVFAKSGELVAPYQKYAMEQLKAENEQLKQNALNKQRSTGSRRTAGSTTPVDAFDEGWDSF